jgi:hypothetical protein
MATQPQFLQQAAAGNGTGGGVARVVGDNSYIGPMQQEDAIHDGAPAGLTFSDAELPSVAVPGGSPMRLGGFSPDPNRVAQTTIAEDPRGLGVTRAPEGIRK